MMGIPDEYSAGGSPVPSRYLRFFISAILLVSVPLLSGQTENATLSGTVTDQSGAVVVSVDIQLTNIESGIISHTVSNQSGLYVFSNVRPGHYRMTVDKAGFRQIILTDLTVNVQEVLGRNFSLKVGALGESVTVSGDSAKINTTDASVSTVIDRQLVENMPLNGRSIQALINLTPGVVLTPASFGEAGQFSVNGQRSDTDYYTLDGVSANIGTSPGAPLLLYGAGVFPGLSASGGTNSLVSVD